MAGLVPAIHVFLFAARNQVVDARNKCGHDGAFHLRYFKGITQDQHMPPVVHPGRLLRRELESRSLSANKLAIDLGVPSGRITDILNYRRSITADTAVRLGRYLVTPRSSGLICKVSTTLASLSANGLGRLHSAALTWHKKSSSCYIGTSALGSARRQGMQNGN